MKKFWISLCAATMIMLTGCQSVRGLLPTAVQRNQLIVPVVAPSEQYPYDWYIINAENASDKFMELSGKGSSTLIGVTPEGFKNLNLSMAELRKFIQEQQAVIDAYRAYYDQSDAKSPTK